MATHAYLASSFKEVMSNLREWSKRNYGNVTRDTKKLRGELANLQLGHADRLVIKNKMNQLDELFYREEMIWLERSCITWHKEGERNTKYFFRRAIWRGRRNHIQRLRKSDGSWCNVPSNMEQMAASYFKEVFTKDPTLIPEAVLNCIVPKVTVEMNEVLCAPYSQKEVSDALLHIDPSKAPSTDGS